MIDTYVKVASDSDTAATEELDNISANDAETEYIKTILNSAKDTDYTALNITEDTGSVINE